MNFKKITTFKNSLSKICSKLLANSDYAFKDLLITPKLKKEGTPDQVKEVNSQQAYSSLLVLAGELLDPIESAYIIEACNSAKAGMNLAAATMLGCAAEQLLKNLSDSYHTYLKNSGDSVKDYESKVIKSKTSYMRLTNFYNYVTSNKKTFEKHGLQNPGASYAVLEIIRQTRNESGHPTGIIISDSNMHELFSLYNVWLPRFHKLMASFNESIVETKN
ncbi:hypothetical protein [Paenibacillus gallinarum]|uniref:RiboL-PSP-HEPN domain-containing protein n=1 Tax=Paenibacillus gallinarum TaxID=2762232 RepID=A0ABR8T6C1_9BACL|nr:hypothetical protein [Paenibacillus gallinarum]MBD7971286.1 hypothetical protein [Paenibacillus gallinarum]